MLGARAASRQKRNSFTSTWDTTQAGSANDSVDLENGDRGLRSNGSYNFKVYWGDGTSDIITTYNQAETLHQYASTGIYEIRMGGEISGFRFVNGGDKDKILNIRKVNIKEHKRYTEESLKSTIKSLIDILKNLRLDHLTYLKNCNKEDFEIFLEQYINKI